MRVVENTFSSWHNKQANETVNKLVRSCSVELLWKNGETTEERISWLAHGAGRDVYRNADASMVFKMYPVKPNYTSNATEAAALRTWYPRLTERLPLLVGHTVCEFPDHNLYLSKTDVVVVQYIGPSLTLLLDAKKESPENNQEVCGELRDWFIGMLEMTRDAQKAGLEWNQDFHSGNFSLSKEGQWFLIHVERGDRLSSQSTAWVQRYFHALIREHIVEPGVWISLDVGAVRQALYFGSYHGCAACSSCGECG